MTKAGVRVVPRGSMRALNDLHYLNGTFAHCWFFMCPTLMLMAPLRI